MQLLQQRHRSKTPSQRNDVHFLFSQQLMVTDGVSKWATPFIHSFICSIKQLKKCAAKCTIEQDSKAKALTAAQKLQNYTKTIHQTNSKSTIISATHTNSK